jgi:hypothetical protein
MLGNFTTEQILQTFIAIFTFMMVIAAYCQVCYTGKTVEVMKNASEKELRAYVAITKLDFTSTNQLILTIKNAGKTPAFDVNTHSNSHFVAQSETLPDNFEFKDYPSTQQNIAPSQIILLPQERKPITTDFNNGFIENFQGGKQKAFVYGWIFYKDIYNKKIRCNFNYEVELIENKLRFKAHNRHNEMHFIN